MEDFITILSVGRPYDIVPESGVGDHVTGCTMSYVTTQDIAANHIDEETGTLGYAVTLFGAFVDAYAGYIIYVYARRILKSIVSGGGFLKILTVFLSE